jgi:hypothetical protein
LTSILVNFLLPRVTQAGTPEYSRPYFSKLPILPTTPASSPQNIHRLTANTDSITDGAIGKPPAF